MEEADDPFCGLGAVFFLGRFKNGPDSAGPLRPQLLLAALLLLPTSERHSMSCCSESTKDNQGELFEPRSRRCCTDVACLVLFLLAAGGSAYLTAASVQRNPQLLMDLVYPTDSYGNNCGRPGTATEGMPSVVYPRLEADLAAQSAVIASGAVWAFSPTRLCASHCPSAFSLASPNIYGGLDYPTTDGVGTESFLYPWSTRAIASRCFPLDDTQALASVALCASPNCTDSTLLATLGGHVSCYAPEAEAIFGESGDSASGEDASSGPAAQSVVWQVCGEDVSAAVCAQQRAACELEVMVTDSRSFQPVGQSPGGTAQLMLYAYGIRAAFDAAAGVSEGAGLSALLIFGVGTPFAMAFLWPLFLWLFARPVIIFLLVAQVTVMMVIAIYCMLKAGWFDAASVSIDLALNSTDSSFEAASEAYSDLIVKAQFALDTVYNGSSAVLAASTSESGQLMWSALAFVQIILTVVNIIMLIVWRECITRLIAILRECCKVFRSIVFILFFPLGRMVMQSALFVYGVIGLYFVIWSWDDLSWGWHAMMVVAHLFVSIWCVTMTRAVSWTTMAGAVAWWFVRQNATDRKCLGRCPAPGVIILLTSLWTVLSRHLGSMAFGSLLIAVCWTLRLLLQALEYSFRGQNQRGMWLLRLTMKSLICCMECLKRTVQFISFYGFIYVAVEGDGFCRACKATFKLLGAHAAQVIINGIVQKLLLLLIGLTTPIGCAAGAFLYLETQPSYVLVHSPFYSGIVIFLLAFLITSATCQVFAVSIDTVFVCAFKDMDENHPPKYLSDGMRAGLGLDHVPAGRDRAAGSGAKVAPDLRTSTAESEPLNGSGHIPFKPPPMPGQLSRKSQEL
jgi:hypothetical protein